MRKVQDAVQVAQTWLNTQMQASTKLPKHATPAVKTWEIRAEKKVPLLCGQSVLSWKCGFSKSILRLHWFLSTSKSKGRQYLEGKKKIG